MRITVIQNGKIRDKHVIALRDEYVKRFKRYGTLKLIEKEPKKGQSLWPNNAWRVLLDERGSVLTSPEFAKQLDTWTMHHGDIALCVGEAYGHDQATKNEADYVLSFGSMVMPHQLAHLFLVEQIYRAGSILAGSRYHHE